MNTENIEDSRKYIKKTEISSQELLAERKELVILHNGERYTLRLTANNKLILTK